MAEGTLSRTNSWRSISSVDSSDTGTPMPYSRSVLEIVRLGCILI